MKRLITFVALFFVLVGASWQVAAVDYDDLKKLKANNACKSCDLSGANLIESNLTGANLFGANLSGADLSGANLTGAKVGEANLSGANVSGANLTGSNLTWADLTGANLSRANLSGVNLTWATLNGANLSGAYLSGANLNGAYLTGAYLTETIICETIMSDGTINNSGCGKSFSATTSKQIAKSEEAPKPESKPELADLVELLDATVVLVSSSGGGGHGSGFFVTPDGYVLTNEHVVADGGPFFIRTLNRDTLDVNVIKTDKQLDLALLKVINPQRIFKSVDIGNSKQLRKGQSVLNIGNPRREEYEHSVTPGHIAGLNRGGGAIQLSLPTYGGQSGSPLFDMNGKVIGVMVAFAAGYDTTTLYTQTQVDDNSSQQADSGKTTWKKQTVQIRGEQNTIGFAIPIDYARGLLELARP